MYSEELPDAAVDGPWISYDEFCSESLSTDQMMLDLFRVTLDGSSLQQLMPPPPVLPGQMGSAGAAGSCRGGQPAATCSVVKVQEKSN